MIRSKDMNLSLRDKDPEVFRAIQREIDRERNTLILIASENYASRAVMEAQASVMTNKYAEGYPGFRYYGGCEFVDEVELLAIKRAKELFRSPYANVQAHSGSQANMGVYFSLLNPGDLMLGMSLSHGGHLTHGNSVNFSGRFFRSISFGVNPETQRIDYDQVRDLARLHRPKIIIAGASAYPRTIDFQVFGEIARETNAYLMVDMAHIAGLVAAGVHPSPMDHADVVTATTHKTLRGPRGGMVLAKDTYGARLDKAIFPGIQGGPLMQVIAAKAVAFEEALTPQFRDYQTQVIDNAKFLAEELLQGGFDLVSQGTDTHLILMDLTKTKLTGAEAERVLGLAGIVVNKNNIPFDKKGPRVTSGLRLGTPALTTRGMGVAQMRTIAQLIRMVLENPNDSRIMGEVSGTVLDLCQSFPVYDYLQE